MSNIIEVTLNGAVGPKGDTGPQGPQGEAGVGLTEIVFSIPASLTTGTGRMRWYVPATTTISNVIASVGTAPTGASIVFDVNKNGTTIFTTQANRPTIAAGTFVDLNSVPDVLTLNAGDYLTVDIDQVGSSVAGAEAVVRIRVA